MNEITLDSTKHNNIIYATMMGCSFCIGAMLIYPLAVYIFNTSHVLQEALGAFLTTSVAFTFMSFVKNQVTITDFKLYATMEIVAFLFFTTILTPKVTTLLFNNNSPTYASAFVYGIINSIVVFFTKNKTNFKQS